LKRQTLAAATQEKKRGVREIAPKRRAFRFYSRTGGKVCADSRFSTNGKTR
jgi:hypothetical protein